YPARSGEAFYWIPGGQLCPYRLQCRTRYSEISAVFVRGETFFGELGSLGQDKKRPDDEKLGPFHHHSEPEIQPHCLAARSRPQEGLSPEKKEWKESDSTASSATCPLRAATPRIIHIDVRMAGVGHPKAFCLDGPRAKRLNKTENSSSYLAQHPGIQNGLDLLAKKD
ncbi:hypothetical protein MGG_17368, partial [Pyricularia oryzae 70-15]